MNLDIVMEASDQELTNMVAEIVMGWSKQELDNGYGYPAPYWVDESGQKVHPYNFWHPASRIEDAWEVANKLGIAVIPQSNEDGTWSWYALDLERVSYRGYEIGLVIKNDSGISANNVPEAICKAAILSVINLR